MRMAMIKFVALVILGTVGSAYAGATMADREPAAPEPIRVRVLSIGEVAAVDVCEIAPPYSL